MLPEISLKTQTIQTAFSVCISSRKSVTHWIKFITIRLKTFTGSFLAGTGKYIHHHQDQSDCQMCPRSYRHNYCQRIKIALLYLQKKGWPSFCPSDAIFSVIHVLGSHTYSTVWKPSVSVAASVVCLSRVSSRKLREIRAKFVTFVRNRGLREKWRQILHRK